MVKSKAELENSLGEEESDRAKHDAEFEALKEQIKVE